MKQQFPHFIGQSHENLEKELGFTHYLETKNFEHFAKIDVNHDALVNAFLTFHGDDGEMTIVRFRDGIIEDFFVLPLRAIEKELRLLKHNEGQFRCPDDGDSATSFGFFTDNYLAEFMQGIIFFSGIEDSVKAFSSVLDSFKIHHFPLELIPSSSQHLAETPSYKLGRNEPCHCGSKKKYKKCCLESDLKETGKTKRLKFSLDLYETPPRRRAHEETYEETK